MPGLVAPAVTMIGSALFSSSTSPVSCGIIDAGFATHFGYCAISPLFTAIGAVFLFTGAALLRLFGFLFDFSVGYGLTNFSGMLVNLHLTDAINTGWTVFRDLANIFIIGLFVFIAINIILGTTTYGQKSLIARVIIVAVLLNFSLLFTKLIINASNATAYQFYNDINAPRVSGQDRSTQQNEKDIAGAFLRKMGMASVFDSVNKPGEVRDAAISSDGKNWLSAASQGLLYGLLGGIMLILTAAVLAYGIFLIITRVVFLIFIMLTAALAFTTFLLPSLAKSEYGFDKWLKALLGYAAFAPLLMIFLWIALSIMNATNVPTNPAQQSDLGQVLTDTVSPNPGPVNPNQTNTAAASASPQNATTAGWGAVWNFLLGLGFLFASFKIAGKLAGSVPGMNAISRFTGGAVGVVAMGAGALVGGAAGGALARRGLRRAEGAKKEANEKANEAVGHRVDATLYSKAGNKVDALRAEKRAQQAEQTAQKALERAGRLATKPNVAVLVKRREDQAKAAASLANKTNVSPQAVAAQAGPAKERVALEKNTQYQGLQGQQTEIQKDLGKLRADRGDAEKKFTEALRGGDNNFAQALAEHDKTIKAKDAHNAEYIMKEKVIEAIIDPEQRKQAKAGLDNWSERAKSDMRIRDSDIRRVRDQLANARAAAQTKAEQGQIAVNELQELKNLDSEMVDKGDALRDVRASMYEMEKDVISAEREREAAIIKEVKEARGNLAASIAVNSQSFTERQIGKIKGGNENLGQDARERVRKDSSQSKWEKRFRDMMKDNKN